MKTQKLATDELKFKRVQSDSVAKQRDDELAMRKREFDRQIERDRTDAKHHQAEVARVKPRQLDAQNMMRVSMNTKIARSRVQNFTATHYAMQFHVCRTTLLKFWHSSEIFFDIFDYPAVSFGTSNFAATVVLNHVNAKDAVAISGIS